MQFSIIIYKTGSFHLVLYCHSSNFKQGNSLNSHHKCHRSISISLRYEEKSLSKYNLLSLPNSKEAISYQSTTMPEDC